MAATTTPASSSWPRGNGAIAITSFARSTKTSPSTDFLTEQLAGDELEDWRSAEHFSPETLDRLVATTFLRCSADDTDENELNTADIRHGVLARTVETVASNLLGLTVNCARCHSHKYDPIPQADYYRLTAIFTPAFNPQAWLQPRDRALADISPQEQAAGEEHNADDSNSKSTRPSTQLAEIRRPYEERLFEAKLATLPEAIRADTKTAVQTPEEKRTRSAEIPGREVRGELEGLGRRGRRGAGRGDRIATASRPWKPNWPSCRSSCNRGARSRPSTTSAPAPATYLLRRGNHDTPGNEVSPGFLSVLCEENPRELFAKFAPLARRAVAGLALARWLTERDTPAAGQTARVMVNRMWQHLFGVGIVETADNFGHSGAWPTHPELLDWLALRWIDEGYRWKPLLKLLMMSTAYRQASSVAASFQRCGSDRDRRRRSASNRSGQPIAVASAVAPARVRGGARRDPGHGRQARPGTIRPADFGRITPRRLGGDQGQRRPASLCRRRGAASMSWPGAITTCRCSARSISRSWPRIARGATIRPWCCNRWRC